jgi:hypothetical protein
MFTRQHNKIILTLAILATGFGFGVQQTFSSPNLEINYQGKLTDNTGQSVTDGDYDMEFNLYVDASTTTALWTESRTGGNQVTVTSGLFSVMLGDVSSLSGVDFNQTLYLGVTVGADSEMTPRKILGTVPAAFVAEDANTLSGVASSSFVRSDQADTVSGLLTFTGGLISNSSSTITNLSFDVATGTTLVVNNEAFTDFTGTALTNDAGVLSVSTTTLATYFASTTDFDTSAELAAILTDETGSGSVVFSASPTLTGTIDAEAGDFSSTLTLSGTAANIALGSNWLSGDGDDEGVFVDGSGNVGVGTTTPTSQLSVWGNQPWGATIDIDSRNVTGGRRWNLLATGGTAGEGQGLFLIKDSTVDQNRIVIDTSGNVGIGTSSPNARLQVAGGDVQFNNSSNGAGLYFAQSTGRLGLGTTTPGSTLTIAGDLYLTGALYDSTNASGTTGQILQTTGSGTEWVATSSLGFIDTTASFGSDNQIPFTNSGGDDFDYSANLTFDGSLLTVTGNANITGNITNATWQGDTISALYIADDVAIGPSGSVDDAALSANVSLLGADIDLSTSEVTGTLPVNRGGTGTTTLASGELLLGNGTSAITSTSTLSAGLIQDAFLLNTGDTATGDYTFDTNTLFIDSTNDRIGIGTTTPSSQLAIHSNSTDDRDTVVTINHDNDSEESSTIIETNNNANLGTITPGSTHTIYSINNLLTPTLATQNSNLDFVTTAGTRNALNVSGVTLGDTGSNRATFIGYGTENTITGTPVFNDTVGNRDIRATYYGTANSVDITPTLTSIADEAILVAAGGDFSSTINSAGNAGLTARAYGVRGAVSGDLTTTGNTQHYGGYFTTTGTADVSYGVYAQASGATTNYDVYAASSLALNYFAGNVGIGTTTPYATLSVDGDLALTGFLYDRTHSTGTAGMVLQTTGSGTEWVATSSLGFSSQSLSLGSSNQIPFMDGSTDFQYSGNLTFDGSQLSITGDLDVTGSITNATWAGDTISALYIADDIAIGPSGSVDDGALSSNVSLLGPDIDLGSSEVTGTLAVSRGGTGTTTLASGELLLGNGTGAVTTIATSSLGLGDGTFLGLSDTPGAYTTDRLLYTTGSAVVSSSSLTFDGSTLTVEDEIRVGDLSLIGNRILYNLGGGELIFDPTQLVLQAGSSDDIIFRSGGLNELVRFTTSGNVGIGTTTPYATLSVAGDLALTGFLYDSTNATGTTGMVLQTTGSGTEWVSTTTLGLVTALADLSDVQSGGDPFSSLYLGTSAGGSQGVDDIRNTAVGISALASLNNSLGYNNTALGFEALTANTSGRSNTAIGNHALTANITGGSNVAVGSNALVAATSTGNTAIGAGAGGAITGGGNNTLLGYLAGDNLTTGSSNIIIGASIDAPSATLSNQLNIGNTIYGDLGGQTISFGTTTAPGSARLTVQSTGSNDILNLFETGGSEVFTVLESGSVGIGTTSPFSLLTVAGDITPATTLTYDLGSSTRRWANLWAETLNVGTSTWSIFNGADGRLAFSDAAEQGGTERLSILTNGNVGIGTTNPASPLTVNGSALLAGSQRALNFGTSTGSAGYGIRDTDSVLQFKDRYGGWSTFQDKLFTDRQRDGSVDLNEATLSTEFNLSDTSPLGITFNNDGSKMYVAGANTDSIYEHTLSTPYDLTTAAETASTSVNAQDTGPLDVAFSEDGTKMFVLGGAGEDVNEYTLGTPFLVTSKSFVDSFDISNESNDPAGLTFTEYGTKMYVLDRVDRAIYEYTLGTAYDVSTAFGPTFTFFINSDTTNPSGLTFSNDRTILYVTDYTDDGIHVYNVEVPFSDTSPVLSASDLIIFQSDDPSTEGAVFSDKENKLFIVGNGNNRVYEYDLTDGFLRPDDITKGLALGTTTLPTSATNTRLHVSNGRILSTPGDPVLVGSVDTDSGGSALGIEIAEDYAYLTTGSNNYLEIYDIADPTNPALVATTSLNDAGVDVARSGNYLYVATEASAGDNLEIFDISNPSNPTKVGGEAAADSAKSITVSGNYAYITSEPTGDDLEIFDIADPTSPVKIGGVELSGSTFDITVVGSYAYIGTTRPTNEFQIVDISDPTSPEIVNDTNTGGSAAVAVAVRGGYAYIGTNGGDEFEVFDVSNPASGVGSPKVGGVDVGTVVLVIQVVGDYAFLGSSGSNDIVIYDISSTTNAVRVAGIDAIGSGSISELVVDGNYIYAGVGSTLSIYDIGGLSTPTGQIGSLLADRININHLLQARAGSFSTGLNVGQNALVGGALTITGTASSTLQSSNSSPALTVASGNVLFGTTTDSARLTIQSNGTNDILNLFETGGTEVFTVLESGNVGVGTSTPGSTLTVAGDLAVTGTTTLNTVPYLWPSSDGSANQVLQTNGSGQLSWGTVSSGGGSDPVVPSFSVHKNGTSQTITPGATFTKITWATEVFDTNSDFDLVNDRFQPSVAGKYLVTVNTYCSALTLTSGYCAAGIAKNGTVIHINWDSDDEDTEASGSISAVVDMNGTTDYLEAFTYTSNNALLSGNSTYTNFTGARIDGSAANFAFDNDNLYYATGTVSIGTSTPQTDSTFTVQGLSGDNLLTLLDTSGNTDFVVTESGSVGVGTSSPGAKLDIYGTNPDLHLKEDANNYGALYWLNSDDSLRFFTAVGGSGADRMVIDSSGNVGIGTTTPSQLLDVVGDSAGTAQLIRIRNAATTGNASAQLNVSSGLGVDGYFYTFGEALYAGAATDHDFAFTTNNAVRMTIDNTGNVGIGTTSPGSTLTVAGDLNVTGTTTLNSVPYVWPGADGSANQVLRTDGAGQLSWASVTSGSSDPIVPAFSVHKNGTNQTVAGGGFVKLTWNTEDFDTNADFDLVNERFQPSVAGKYVLSAGVGTQNALPSGQNMIISIFKNGSEFKRGVRLSSGAATGHTTHVSAVVDANGTTDYFEVYVFLSASSVNVFGSSVYTYFTGARIDGSAANFAFDNDNLYYATGTVTIGSSTPQTDSTFTVQGLSGDNLLTLLDNSGNTDFIVTEAGNVGIGTSSPAELLHVYSTSDADIRLSTVADSDYSSLALYRADAAGGASDENDYTGSVQFWGYDGANYLRTAEILSQVDATPGSNDMPGSLLFTTTADGASAPTERMRIDSAGNVGIGTTSPSVGGGFTPKLSLAGSFAALSIEGTSAGNKWGLGVDSGGDLDFFDSTNDGYTSRMLLDSSTGALEVSNDPANLSASSGNTTPGTIINGSASAGWAWFATNDAVYIQRHDNTDGNAMRFYRGSSLVGSISLTSSATAYNTTSDVRLKENIASSTMGLSTLRELQVRDYNFINNPDQTLQGFLAQELYEVYPDAVFVGGADPLEDPWAVDYGRLTPLIVQSVQDLASSTASVMTLTELMHSTTTDLFADGTATFWERLIELATNFVDGTLALVGLSAERVSTDELCVGDTCIDEATLIQVLAELDATPSGSDSTNNPPADDGDNTNDSGSGGGQTNDNDSGDTAPPTETSTSSTTATSTVDGGGNGTNDSSDTSGDTATTTDPVDDGTADPEPTDPLVDDGAADGGAAAEDTSPPADDPPELEPEPEPTPEPEPAPETDSVPPAAESPTAG